MGTCGMHTGPNRIQIWWTSFFEHTHKHKHWADIASSYLYAKLQLTLKVHWGQLRTLIKRADETQEVGQTVEPFTSPARPHRRNFHINNSKAEDSQSLPAQAHKVISVTVKKQVITVRSSFVQLFFLTFSPNLITAKAQQIYFQCISSNEQKEIPPLSFVWDHKDFNDYKWCLPDINSCWGQIIAFSCSPNR